MKKSYLAILLAIALGAGAVFGAYVTKYVWETTMTMRLMGIHTYNVELQYPNGTAITDYDWGNFSYSETKLLDCNLAYLGNGTYVVYWNTTDLPDGWYMQVWQLPLYDLWEENQIKTAVSASYPPQQLNIYLTAPPGGGVLDEPLGFTMNFVAAEETL